MNIAKLCSLVCLFVMSASLCGACWSTEGPGPGPYSLCVEARDCGSRDQPVCLQKASEEDDGDPEPLFCSTPCIEGDPQGCPLVGAYPELTPMCLEPLEGEGTYCALTTAALCPDEDGMSELEIDGMRVCVFGEANDLVSRT